MTQPVRFHFDPRCPWAWETSKWIREVATVRDVVIGWRLFSLYVVNGAPERLEDPDDDRAVALRTLALVAELEGNSAVGSLYVAIGERAHDGDEAMTKATIRAALSDIGLDETLLERAASDRSTIEAVLRDHRAAVDDVGAFGVPTIVLSSGKGIFGPVVSVAPSGEEAGVLWDHVAALADKDYFFELKRDRADISPGAGR
jgi:2-hydroxychromene-2-carboxylate isomerase